MVTKDVADFLVRISLKIGHTFCHQPSGERTLIISERGGFALRPKNNVTNKMLPRRYIRRLMIQPSIKIH